jgi:hypothetical protein
MSMSSMAGVASYTASSGNDRLYPIVINIQNTQGGWTPVSCLSDTGNEISIFKREVADSLGLNMGEGESFRVAGINGSGREFRRFKLLVRIGTLEPIRITIGFAMKHGDLVENLLGNADVLKSGKFEVTYNKDGVTYTQKSFSARVAGCAKDSYHSEQSTLNNLYDQLTTRRKRGSGCGCHGLDDHDKDTRDGGDHNHIAAYGLYLY